MSLRGWCAFLVATAVTILGAPDAARLLIEPRYIPVPLADHRDLGDATLALDRSEIRWRTADGGMQLRVENGRAADASRILASEGLLRRAARRRAPEPLPERTIAAELERRTNALLAATVGADRARVALTVDLDRDRRSERQLRYGRRGPAESRRREAWRLRGDFANGDGLYDTTDWAVDKRVRSVRYASGRVRRLSAALVIDPAVRRRDAAAVRRAVRAALGIGTRRGDVLRTSRAPVQPPANARPAVVSRSLAIVRWPLLALALAAFLFEIWRSLRRTPPGGLAPAGPRAVLAAPPRHTTRT